MGDSDYTTFSVRLTEGIILGGWFDWLAEDQGRRFPQAQIGIDMESAESGWIFYTSRWLRYPLFIRTLNLCYAAIEDKIEKNQVIYIKRVKSINQIRHEED